MYNIKHEKMKGPKCGDKNKFRVHLVLKTDSLVEVWMLDDVVRLLTVVVVVIVVRISIRIGVAVHIGHDVNG